MVFYKMTRLIRFSFCVGWRPCSGGPRVRYEAREKEQKFLSLDEAIALIKAEATPPDLRGAE